MNFRTTFAVMAGRFVQWFLKSFTSGGSSLPGKIATKIDPYLLKELGKDYEVIVITGTNGKTVTTSLTVNILKQKYEHVMTNDTGSNMLQGIVSSFIEDNKNKKLSNKIAVLEIDEASLRHVTEHIKPKVILVTNLFPDQMDRYGHPNAVYDLILEGVNKTPQTTLLLNGDAPILNSQTINNPTFYYGFNLEENELLVNNEQLREEVSCPKCGAKLHYHSFTYSDLGNYYCENCGFKRPKLDNVVDKIVEMTTESSKFSMDAYEYELPMAGVYNIYNALAAYSLARVMDVSKEDISLGLNTANRAFGRQEVIKIKDKDVRMNLIKNPVGLNEIINLMQLEKEEFSLITILNDNAADGRDISWIEDGDFEKFKDMPIKNYYVSGIRKESLKTRFIDAGIEENQLIELADAKQIIDAVTHAKTDKVYILTTYTAMLNLREEMYEQGFVKSKMKA